MSGITVSLLLTQYVEKRRQKLESSLQCSVLENGVYIFLGPDGKLILVLEKCLNLEKYQDMLRKLGLSFETIIFPTICGLEVEGTNHNDGLEWFNRLVVQ